jgi:hypothetical protein
MPDDAPGSLYDVPTARSRARALLRDIVEGDSGITLDLAQVEPQLLRWAMGHSASREAERVPTDRRR